MSVPQVVYGDTTAVSSPSELMSLIVASGKVECLSRNFFRSPTAAGRRPPTVARWRTRARRDGRRQITDLAAAAVKAAQFKRRTFQ
jgi:hypothetical protein